MKIAIAASEVAPFAKCGGLADVMGSLPKALIKHGCDVIVFMPKYSSIDEEKYNLHYVSIVGEMHIRVGDKIRIVHVLKTKLPGSKVDVYMIDCPHYFNRSFMYTNDPDEHERFILFSKAVIETLQRLKWVPDVIHCNDWQTGMIPAFIKDNYSWDTIFNQTATIMSIHNIAYQGRFSPEIRFIAESKAEWYYPGGPYEFYGSFCFLKTGIVFSEMISTVSETYSREIQTPEYGEGMHVLLNEHSDKLLGILNGIDDDVWNPKTDKHIFTNYTVDTLEKKENNKIKLLKKTNIKYVKGKPLIGMISRMVDQKGFDLMAEVFQQLIDLDAQWIILGSGEDNYEQMAVAMERAAPGKIWSYIGFSNELSHQIEAGADIFLMPSRFEPCGLNQMYSLQYGTVPIVRKTGGLADTVKDWDEYKWDYDSEAGNGFVFTDSTAQGMLSTIWRCLHVYYNYPDVWKKIQINGMIQDFSWNNSAKKYIDLYQKAMNKRRDIS
jgi:starch synthase